MGYQIYKVGHRWGGYGVPAVCEYPDCNEEIDRGISYACGGEPFSEHGCDLYFCEKHREYHCFNTGSDRECAEVCERCAKKRRSFPYKPEVKKWVKHLLKDKSWAEWRKENPDEVEKLTTLTKQEIK